MMDPNARPRPLDDPLIQLTVGWRPEPPERMQVPVAPSVKLGTAGWSLAAVLGLIAATCSFLDVTTTGRWWSLATALALLGLLGMSLAFYRRSHAAAQLARLDLLAAADLANQETFAYVSTLQAHGLFLQALLEFEGLRTGEDAIRQLFAIPAEPDRSRVTLSSWTVKLALPNPLYSALGQLADDLHEIKLCSYLSGKVTAALDRQGTLMAQMRKLRRRNVPEDQAYIAAARANYREQLLLLEWLTSLPESGDRTISLEGSPLPDWMRHELSLQRGNLSGWENQLIHVRAWLAAHREAA